jgi:uncharacterized protein
MIFRNLTREQVLAERGFVARTPLARTVGLMFRRSLPPGEGLFITPCSSIHMWFVFFRIDVAFVDRDLRVVRVRRRLPPFWLAFGGKGAWSVFELPAGTLERTGTREGDQLAMTSTAQS